MNRREILASTLAATAGISGDLRLKLIKHLSPNKPRPGWMKWSPSKTHLLAEGSEVSVYDLKSGNSKPVIELNEGYPTPFTWHPSSQLFAVGSPHGEVRVFDGDLKEQKPFAVGGREIVSIDWRPKGGLFLATSRGGRLCIWDSRTRDLLYQRGVASECLARWSHDGSKVALSCSIGEVIVLDVAEWKTHFVIEADPRNDYLERSPIAWSLDDAELYVAHHGGEPKVKVWSIAQRAFTREMEIGKALGLHELHALKDRACLLRVDETLRYIQGGETKNLPVVSENAFSHDVDARGRFVAGVANDAWLFRARDRRTVRSSCGTKGGASAALTADGSMLAVGCDDGGIRVYSISS